MRFLILFLINFLSFSFLMAQCQDTPVLIHGNGSNSEKVIFYIFGDGYRSTESSKFSTDAVNIKNQFLNTTPFDEYQNFFKFYSLFTQSVDSGVDHPADADDEDNISPAVPVADVNNIYSTSFDIGGIHRLLSFTDYNPIYIMEGDCASHADQILVLANTSYYGGAGGDYAVTSTHSSAGEIAIHEVGHSFADLGDEYWAGDQYARERPNLTANRTQEFGFPWPNWLGDQGIGAYRHTGTNLEYYRPHQNCKMRYLGSPFCAVCKEAIIDKIYDLVDPVTGFSPQQSHPVMEQSKPIIFEMDLIYPSPNTLTIEWYINETLFASDESSIVVHSNDIIMGNDANLVQVIIKDETAMLRHPISRYTFTQEWKIDASNIKLPVQFINFTATEGKGYVSLDWETSRIPNGDKFIIERSIDGEKFTPIGELAMNSPGEAQVYRFLDRQPLKAKSYYRIQQLDTDGDFIYSTIRYVSPLHKFFYKILSNPTIDVVDLQLYTNRTQEVIETALFSPNGQLLQQKTLTINTGFSTHSIDVSNYPAGIYRLRLTSEGRDEWVDLTKI